MKSVKELILESLNFWSLERRGDDFIFCSNGLELNEKKELRLENEEDFQEVKTAIIEKLKNQDGLWKEHEMKIIELPPMLAGVSYCSYDLHCFTTEEQEEIRKFVPKWDPEAYYSTPWHNKSDINWRFIATIAIGGTLLLFLVIWMIGYFRKNFT